MEPLIPSTLLYRFSLDCRRFSGTWNKKTGAQLGDEFQLPHVQSLDGQRTFADVRLGWSESGLILNVDVTGKGEPPFCRPNQVTDSDAVHVLIDARDVRTSQRANQFCHWFVFLPLGGGNSGGDAFGTMLKINRAMSFPKTFGRAPLEVTSSLDKADWSLAAHIPAAAIDGWNVQDQPRLGFSYVVNDRELGQQALSTGAPYPILENPGLWQSLELIDA